MATLKDLIVNGNSSLVGALSVSNGIITTMLTASGTLTANNCIYANNGLQTKILSLPTASGGSSYGYGTANYVPISNGSTVYWGKTPIPSSYDSTTATLTLG